MKENEPQDARKVDQFTVHQAHTALAYVRGRRTDFQATGLTLSKSALHMSRCSSIMTVLVIVSGAFVGMKAVMDKLLGSTNALNVLIYALTGLLIAVLSGLESAFKWNSKSAELRTLAAKCRRSEHAIDIGLRRIPRNDLKAATALLKQVDEELDAIESAALKVGVDLQKSMYLGMSPEEMEKLGMRYTGRKSSTLLENSHDTSENTLAIAK